MESVAFAADAYVIMLGTNDAWHGPEPTTFSFTKGLTDIVQWIRNAHPGCSVLLVLPPGCKDGRCSRNLANIVHPAVRDVAKAEHTFLVEPDLSPQSCYAKDKIHLSAEGASTVAAAVARAVESTIASAVARSVETVEPARKRRKPTGKLNDSGISHRTWQALCDRHSIATDKGDWKKLQQQLIAAGHQGKLGSCVENTDSVEKPVHAVELWNVHCPASRKYPYGPDARARGHRSSDFSERLKMPKPCMHRRANLVSVPVSRFT